MADACLETAWLDDIPDHVRWALEHAHDVIESLMARAIATSKVLETVEAELQAMRPHDDDDAEEVWA